jgi:hypothetical protein
MGSVIIRGPAALGFLSSKREGNKRRSMKTSRTRIKKMILPSIGVIVKDQINLVYQIFINIKLSKRYQNQIFKSFIFNIPMVFAIT